MDRAKVLALRDMAIDLEPQASILEVGFGDGSFLKALTEKGYLVTGTETSESMVKQVSREVVEARVIAADDLVAADSDFDAVCCFEVLEHVEEPIALASQFLAKSLYASVPNPRRWYPAITGRYEYWDFPPNHLWRFCTCPPLGPDHHEEDCKQSETPIQLGHPRMMSIRWVLDQAGYETASINSTSVDGDDLLRVVPIKEVSSDYDEMRPKSGARRMATLAKTLLTPATVPIAGCLSLVGFRGVSYYIHAQR